MRTNSTRLPIAGVAAEFEALLDNFSNERPIQSFLKRFPYIVRNALNVHAWSSVHVQPEFSFGGVYRADFLILSEDSGGWHTVIELESPMARPFTKYGNPSKALAKGLAQLNKWEIWIGKHDVSFRNQLSLLLGAKCVPKERSSTGDHRHWSATIRDPHTVIDKHYVVVVGRRSFFCDSDSQEHRGVIRGQGRPIATYDRLLDMARQIDPSYRAAVDV